MTSPRPGRQEHARQRRHVQTRKHAPIRARKRVGARPLKKRPVVAPPPPLAHRGMRDRAKYNPGNRPAAAAIAAAARDLRVRLNRRARRRAETAVEAAAPVVMDELAHRARAKRARKARHQKHAGVARVVPRGMPSPNPIVPARGARAKAKQGKRGAARQVDFASDAVLMFFDKMKSVPREDVVPSSPNRPQNSTMRLQQKLRVREERPEL